MTPVRRLLGWAGGMAGAAVTGTAVSLAAYGSRVAARRRDAAADDPYAVEPLGDLAPTRRSTVVADDGLPLAVYEVDPPGDAKSRAGSEVTVVLVHGLAVDARSWYFQRHALAERAGVRVRLVLYDQRSHGESDRSSKQRCTIGQLARDLDTVLRSVVPSGPVVLAGHSLGGMAVLGLAEQRLELFRDRVRGVALVSTSAGDVGRSGLPRPVLARHNPLTRGLGVLSAMQPGLVERARRTSGQIVWSLVRALAFGSANVSPALVDLMERMISATPVEVMTNFLDTIGAHDRYAALAALRSSAALVLCGDADRITPFVHAQSLAAELPGAELVRAEGAGHMVMLERPDLVTDHLAELTRRVAQTRRRKRA